MLHTSLLLLAVSFGDDPGTATDSEVPEQPAASARDEQLDMMRQVVAEFDVRELVGKEQRPVPLVKTPLLRFNDGERRHVDGTLWVWDRQGRPLVFSEVYLKQNDGVTGVYHSLVSASTNRLSAHSPVGVRWEPSQPGIELKAFPAETSPAKDPSVRLRQMKTLIRRFRAWSIGHDGHRSELRLLTRPVHRYEELETGLTDGVAFAFVSGTNPEVIVLLEAIHAETGKASWQYAVLRRGNAAQYVSLDDTVVWQRPERLEGGPDQTWLYYFYTPTDRSASGHPQLSGGVAGSGD